VIENITCNGDLMAVIVSSKCVEMIEVKQGPYVGDADKTRFVGIDTAQVKIVDPSKL
jgi:hypothetical protein